MPIIAILSSVEVDWTRQVPDDFQELVFCLSRSGEPMLEDSCFPEGNLR